MASSEEEQGLLAAAAPHLKLLIIAALDTGMRRGQMLSLTWADTDARSGWIRLRGTTTKSGKTRWVPIPTVRLQAVLDYLRLDAAGSARRLRRWSSATPSESRSLDFAVAWQAAILRALRRQANTSGREGSAS